MIQLGRALLIAMLPTGSEARDTAWPCAQDDHYYPRARRPVIRLGRARNFYLGFSQAVAWPSEAVRAGVSFEKATHGLGGP